MPDSATAARFVISVGSTGAFAHLETHELFSSEEVLQMMRGAKAVRYSAPGDPMDFVKNALP